MFRKYQPEPEPEITVEQRLDTIIKLVKDLPKKDFENLLEAERKAWEAYELVSKVETRDEREQKKVENIDLDFEEN